MTELDPALESVLLAAATLAPLANGERLEYDAYISAAAAEAGRRLDVPARWLPQVLQGFVSGLVATHLISVSNSNGTSVYSLTSQGRAYMHLVESRLAVISRTGGRLGLSP